MTEFVRPTVEDYQRAYREGHARPTDLVQHALDAIRQSDRLEPSLDAFALVPEDEILEEAAAADARLEDGEVRGPLDGIPIAVKDEFDVTGHPTTAGTSFRSHRRATKDATVVARLRDAGAIILGKTVMTEIGLGGIGINPNQKTPRNPYDPARFTGGSSSGSAAAVSAGICPLAVGSDAGGSVRMPAAICGIYGFKPTYGRIPSTGGALLAWTLDHVGPLGASVHDLMAFYEATAGADPADETSLHGPKPRPILGTDAPDLAEMTFGWCRDFADDADDGVGEAFHDALNRLSGAGADVVEVELSWAEQIQRVGYVTIASEAATSQREWLRDHRSDYNLDTRLLLAIGERFSAVEYLHAQRVRSKIRREFDRVFEDVDVFLNPTLACTAGEMSDAALEATELDSETTGAVARYTFAGTLTGMPGLSIPCGSDRDGLPVGLHLMGPAWSDERLLGIGAAVDLFMPPMKRPNVYYDTVGR